MQDVALIGKLYSKRKAAFQLDIVPRGFAISTHINVRNVFPSMK